MTYEQAIDDMFSQFFTVWKDDSAAIVGYIPDVIWHGVEEGVTPDRAKFWARASHKASFTEQAAFTIGPKRFTSKGILYIQIFCPFTAQKAVSVGRKLAVLVRNAYSGKESVGGVWFRNPKIVDRPVDKDWFQLVVSVEYSFDEDIA